jgi:trans-2-enoyl-CoA reductase
LVGFENNKCLVLNAGTIGCFFEKPPTEGKTASPNGWYNSAAFIFCKLKKDFHPIN